MGAAAEPQNTGAAKAVGLVLPRPAGRLDGVAVRVPVVDASLVDLTVRITEPATAAQVNAAFQAAADAQLIGILRCTDEPVVSHDVIGENASCLLDTGLTRVAGRMVKVFGWYDNEWATPSARSTWSRWWPDGCPPSEATMGSWTTPVAARSAACSGG